MKSMIIEVQAPLLRSRADNFPKKSQRAVKSFGYVVLDFLLGHIALADEAMLHVQERDELAGLAEVFFQHDLVAGSIFKDLFWLAFARAHEHRILQLFGQVVNRSPEHLLDGNRRMEVDPSRELLADSRTLVPDRPASPAEAHKPDGLGGQLLFLEVFVHSVHVRPPSLGLPFLQERRKFFGAEVRKLALISVVEIGHDDVVALLGKLIANSLVTA
mmetsp:Transcript_17274/g.32790  ORF Transcript_17274/g.32790 Transcript_17274/m.32790 type:complete len:216 (+) Transcript_17274:255-902(+)